MKKLHPTLLALINFCSGKKSPIALPFHNIDGYIMISGSVEGTQGKFMFDTGTPFDFLLNNKKLNLISDEFVSSGQAGSGQPITIFRQQDPVLANLFYGSYWQECLDVKHSDFEFIQKGVSSDFIGMIGSEFVRNKPFSIDYENNEIMIYDTLPEITGKYIKITVSDGQLPEFDLDMEGVKIVGYFDTGSLGTLMLTKDAESTLLSSRKLNVTSSSWVHGEPKNVKIANISEVKYKNQDLGCVGPLTFTNGESNRLALGYSFLRKNKSIWDLANQAIYITECVVVN